MKTFLYNFFPIYQNVGQTLSKKQRKASEKDCENYQDLSEEKKNKKGQYVRERYRSLSEEKNRNRQHGRKRYKSLSEDEKQRLIQYRKSYSKMWANKTNSQIKNS